MPKSKNEKNELASNRVSDGGIDERPEADIDMSTRSEDDRSILRRRLDVMVKKIGVPARKPELGTRTGARYSSAADEALKAVVSTLYDRYKGRQLSKSTVVDYSVRVIVRDVVENAEDSGLVKWADQALQRKP